MTRPALAAFLAFAAFLALAACGADSAPQAQANGITLSGEARAGVVMQTTP